MRFTIFVAAALTALVQALPMAEPAAQLVDSKPGSTIELGKPSTAVTWGRRDLVEVKPGSTIELGKPSTVVTWGKRDLVLKPSQSKDTIELSPPSTIITWGERD
ncbi:uncharacterized protein EKO05_0001354 [Ascochyta rabiei]|uniref:Uncharacterized protein n=1 Tax=Didymella rabiei TaxID=5454 RepID=A0A163LH45_DIDRA|nr:uncharacterized protein EKO05_0001354 [Ascochyta rabiei]KZM27798.1 hypothetical protein ST47_g1061 [Ascochyta rabiei]UPX10712.1 hypothetical protein EKO05_0001354 [Ascochyta rabiei]